MKKNYRKLPLFAVLTITLVICVLGVRDNSNYYKKYKAFLNYTLGGVEGVEKEKVKYSGGAPVPQFGSYIKWYIKYLDVNGVEGIFILNNHKKFFSSKSTDDEYFANQIFNEAKKLTEEQIKEDVLYKYYEEVVFEFDKSFEEKENASNYYLYISDGLGLKFQEEVEYSLNFTDKDTGVKLSEVTPQIMVSDYGYKYAFVFKTYNQNQDEITKDLEVFQKAIIETAEYLNQETVYFSFKVKYDKSFNCKGIYSNITKQFEFE